jgi:xanthine dehydrogenase small subunit
MRDQILFFVNGVEQRVSSDDTFLTLSDYLRKRLGMCGTKIVCSEGDCGSCSVLCGKPTDHSVEYRTIDSCIRFVFQLDGTHVITVEGIACPNTKELHRVQKAMIDCHGSQCGYCTPGFVVAMAGILENNESPSEETWRRGLSGNLCRCTGYSPIVAAGLQASQTQGESVGQAYDEKLIREKVASQSNDSIRVESGDGRTVFCPTTLDEALSILASHPDCKVIAGGTDLGVQFNKGRCSATQWLDLNRVSELSHISIEDEQVFAGASTTWQDVQKACKERFPQFDQIIELFGSPQIRSVGTIGGNIINASPIADSSPFLFVSEAILELSSKSGSRTVNINDFYKGYKKFDLKPGELLTRVTIPAIPQGRKLELYKVSRRLDMDISTFTGAIWVDLDGEKIRDAGVAFGAVGPVVLRLRKTEEFLRGKLFSMETMTEAGEIAVSEIAPITDVRGSEQFRLNLARSILLKFYHQCQTEGQTA